MKKLGVYIHIPFCASKCAYCDFYSITNAKKLMPKYQQALIAHIRESRPQLDGYYIDTVYFGGGTPSYYGAARLIEIFETLKECGQVLLDSEVTAEVNPDSITLDDLIKMRKAGFNRLSVGVQSANDNTLQNLGRRHNFAKAEKAIQNARKAGFENISVDLMYGLPSQSREDWANTISRTLTLKPDHFSCYALKIEEGTPLYVFKDSPFMPDEDTQADMYLYAVEELARHGYPQYEISNFARRGYESKHNMKYWRGDEYIGFGAAAHSYIGGLRYSYIANAAAYSDNIITGGIIVDQREEISKPEQAGEYLMLGLRTVMGITAQEYANIYPCSFDKIEKLLRYYQKKGWAIEQNGRWRLTPEGFLISNVLIGQLLEAQTQQRVTGTPWLQSDFNTESQISMFEKRAEERFS
jgi:putative oxygen-independent coproporphyrinogen III oxidase